MAQPVRNVWFGSEERKKHLGAGDRVAESEEAETIEGARQELGGASRAATFNLCSTTAHDEACFLHGAPGHTGHMWMGDLCVHMHMHTHIQIYINI